MTTWKRGRGSHEAKLVASDIPVAVFLDQLADHLPAQVPGAAVYLHSRPGSVPPALLANFQYHHALQENLAVVTVIYENIPRVPPAQRLDLIPLGVGWAQLILHVGYMEESHVPRILANSITDTLHFDPHDTTYILGRETLLVTPQCRLARWRAHLFVAMSRNARNAALFFQLPPDHVIEVGVQIEL